MPKTLVVGVTFVDVKGFAKENYDSQGRNLGSVKIVHGGVSRNVVEDFANVGMPVSFASVLDDSAFGRDVARRLEKSGADLSYTVFTKDNGLGMWLVILDEKGSLAGSISCMPDLSLLERNLNENGEKMVSEAENIVLEIDLNEAIAETVLNLANKYNKKVYSLVGNLSVILEHPEYLQKTSCFICNEIEAARIFDSDISHFSPEQMLDFLPNASKDLGISSIVVTMGEQGSVFCDHTSGIQGICPIVPTCVVDTSGAGDAFFAGTVMSLTRGLPIDQAVRFGAKLASKTISCEESSCPECVDFFEGY